MTPEQGWQQIALMKNVQYSRKRGFHDITRSTQQQARPFLPEWRDMTRTIVGQAFDTSPSHPNGPINGPLGALNAIQEGDRANHRNGRSITMRKLVIRIAITIPEVDVLIGSAPTTTNYFLALVLDQAPNGAAPIGEDIYITGVTQSLTANPIRNLTQGARFKVLKQWRKKWHPQHPTALTDGAYQFVGEQILIRDSFPLDITSYYSGPLANISDISKNALHLFAFSDYAHSGTAIDFQFRIRYLSSP